VIANQGAEGTDGDERHELPRVDGQGGGDEQEDPARERQAGGLDEKGEEDDGQPVAEQKLQVRLDELHAAGWRASRGPRRPAGWSAACAGRGP
jgi:hypothetical protein